MNQDRLKSPVVWVAIGAQIVAILTTIGALDIGQSEAVNAVIAGVMQLLVVFGVLNNPTNHNNF